MTIKPLYQIIAEYRASLENCRKSDLLSGWERIWSDALDSAVEALPRGGGFDSYPVMEDDKYTPDKMVFRGSFHSMDEHGRYNGWRDYRIVVRPAFDGFRLTITGGGEHRDLIADHFAEVLNARNESDYFRPDIKEVTPRIAEPMLAIAALRGAARRLVSRSPDEETRLALVEADKAADQLFRDGVR